MPTTVASIEAIPDPRIVAVSAQRPAALAYSRRPSDWALSTSGLTMAALLTRVRHRVPRADDIVSGSTGSAPARAPRWRVVEHPCRVARETDGCVACVFDNHCQQR